MNELMRSAMRFIIDKDIKIDDNIFIKLYNVSHKYKEKNLYKLSVKTSQHNYEYLLKYYKKEKKFIDYFDL